MLNNVWFLIDTKATSHLNWTTRALNIKNIDSGEITDLLYNRFEIATRSGAHCAPGAHESFGTVAQGMVRFSFSHYNTIEDVDKAIDALKVIEEESK